MPEGLLITCFFDMESSGSTSDLTTKTKACIKQLEYAWFYGGKKPHSPASSCFLTALFFVSPLGLKSVYYNMSPLGYCSFSFSLYY